MSAQPSHTPDKGWMGDRARGASLGRPSRFHPGNTQAEGPKLHLARIALDSGGYDRGGAYWGSGGYLWKCWDDAGEVYLTGRVYAGSEERKATYARLQEEAGGFDAFMHKHRNREDLSNWITRETAKDQVRAILGDAVRFYR